MPWERTALPTSERIDFLDGEVSTWGSCRNSPWLTSLFYSEDKADQAEALSICGNCAVELECRELAKLRKERWGIWGGQTEMDRDPTNVRKRRQREREAYARKKKAGAASAGA